jgi:hypothetical protein
MTVEMGKEYTTRDGRPVRIYAVDGGGQFPVHCAVRDDDGSWIARASKIDGTWGALEDRRDLIEAPRKFRLEGFVNINFIGGKAFIGGLYDERQKADDSAHPCRVACVPITIDCREGDGLAKNKED